MGGNVLKGFKEFILRGNVIELAVAVVIGAAFTAVVNSIVENLINPLIGVLFQADSLDTALIISIPTLSGGMAEIRFGAVLGAIIAFVIVATVVYFVFVLPMNTLKERAEAYKIEQDQLEEHYRQRSLLKLSVYPEDIAAAVKFFCTEAPKSTGNILNVDAGNAVSFTR